MLGENVAAAHVAHGDETSWTIHARGERGDSPRCWLWVAFVHSPGQPGAGVRRRPAINGLRAGSGGTAASWKRLPPEESKLAGDIEELDQALGKAEVAVAEAEASRSTTQDERERRKLEETVRVLKAQQYELRAELEEKELELREVSDGGARLVKTEAHRPLLFDAARTAASELTIVSAWINSRTLDDELCRALVAAIGKGVTVRIAWGFGTHGGETQRNRVKGDKALDELRSRIPRAQRRRLIVKRIETHEKFVICDDRFCVWGSFNWLSYRGQRDEGYRRETSSYSERPGDVALWKANAETLFA